MLYSPTLLRLFYSIERDSNPSLMASMESYRLFSCFLMASPSASAPNIGGPSRRLFAISPVYLPLLCCNPLPKGVLCRALLVPLLLLPSNLDDHIACNHNTSQPFPLHRPRGLMQVSAYSLCISYLIID